MKNDSFPTDRQFLLFNRPVNFPNMHASSHPDTSGRASRRIEYTEEQKKQLVACSIASLFVGVVLGLTCGSFFARQDVILLDGAQERRHVRLK